MLPICKTDVVFCATCDETVLPIAFDISVDGIRNKLADIGNLLNFSQGYIFLHQVAAYPIASEGERHDPRVVRVEVGIEITSLRRGGVNSMVAITT